MPEFFDLTDHDDFVAVLTLNRPPVNALSRAVFTELEEKMASLNADSEARAVVITGGDKVFSAGVDIRELRAAPTHDAEVLCTLLEGETFGVLDVTGAWAWGSMSLAGPTGYIHIDRLEPLP